MFMCLKRALAVLTVGLHILTFCGPVHADVIDIPGGTEKTVENLPDGSSIRVIGSDGNPDAASRGILTVLNQVNINQGFDVIGIVALLAQMGIHIAPTAEINVTGGLILSTLGIDKAAFLAGLNEIAVSRGMNDPAMILNKGKINLDANSFLVMLASAVKNVGHIAAHGGTVIMAAGDEGILGLGGDGLVSVKITKAIEAEVMDFQGNKVSDVISNDGTISANGGIVTLTAKGSEELFDSIINHTGIIEAKSIGEKNGKIVLDGGDEGVVSVNGKLDASGKNNGEKGGTVHVLGDKVGLFEHARIDVSGYAGGGEVLVGGDYKGHEAVWKANYAYMDSGAEINADAIYEGDGGIVVLWSNQATRAYGTISAKGGAQSGNGGLVETSGSDLDIGGIRVDASSSNGKAGQWLIDPTNISINAATAATYSTSLNNGTDVIVSTDGTITLESTATISKTSGNQTVKLELITTGSGKDITLSGIISASSGILNIILTATGKIKVNNTVTTPSGAVTLTAGDAITQSGAMTGTTLTAKTLKNGGGAAITLTNSSNEFSTVNLSSRNAADTANANGAISYRDATGYDISGLQTGGTATLTAGGAITDSGALVVGNTTTLVAGTNDIILDTATNNFDTVAVTSGQNVTLVDTDAIDLGASTISGMLDVTANGAISDSGNLTVTGTTTLAAGSGNDIKLDKSNDFGAVAITSGKNVELKDTSAIDLGASTVSGTLKVTAASDITQSGAITASNGASTFTVTAASKNILLGTKANHFGAQTVTMTASGGGSSIQDISFRNADATAVAPTMPASLRNLTLQFDAAPIALAARTLSGTLDVTAGGTITDSGNLTVTGTTTLVAGATNDITLNNSNNFSTVAITSGNNVTLNDTNAIVLGTSTVSGTLGVTANGTITDSGNLTVTGTTTLASGATNDITLNNSNNFSTVAITSGNNVTLADTNAIDLGASTVSGTLGVTADGTITDSGNLSVSGVATFAAGTANNITFDNNNNFSAVAVTSGNHVTLKDTNAVILGASTINGDLGVTASGTITDSGDLSVGGTTTLAAGTGNDITLNNSNDFGTVVITTGRNVTLVDTNAIDLGASTVSGTLSIMAGGDITQSGALSVTSGSSAFTINAGANKNVLLGTEANHFGSQAVTITTSGGGSIQDVSFRNVDSSPASPTFPSSLRNLTLQFDSAGVALSGATLTGDLSVTAGGAITQTGALSVDGTTSLTAGSGNDITLDAAANNLVGAVSVVSGKDVTLVNTAALDLGASTISGNLDATGAGITDSGTLSVTGTTTLSAAGNNIILDEGSNDFTGAVKMTNVNDATLADTNAIKLGASTVSGNLDVKAGGAITDTGKLVIDGTATFTTSTSSNVTLDQANNNFKSAVNVVSAKNVTLVDTNKIELGNISISGKLDVTAGGAITGNGTLDIGNTTTLDSSGNNIKLEGTTNDFQVSVSIVNGNEVTLVASDAVDMAASVINGDLKITAGGAITDSGALSIAGTTTLDATGTGGELGVAKNIRLDDGGNSFGGAIDIVNGNNVTLVNGVGAVKLSTSNVAGNLNVTANGNITDIGTITVAGTTTLDATGNNINLNDVNNDFTGAVKITSGNDVTLVDQNALKIGASTVSGDLKLTANGLISDVGAITVTGITTLDAGAGNSITLNNTANDFTGAVKITNANDVTLVDATALKIGVSTVSGDLNVTANGNITDTGTITVTGITTLDATGNNITLNSAANDFTGAVKITNANEVTLVDATDLKMGASAVSGDLKLTAGGAITDSGNISASTLEFSAGTSVTLDRAGNDFDTVAGTASGNVKIVDVDDITIGTVGATTGIDAGAGTISIQGGGDVTLTGIQTTSAATNAIVIISTGGAIMDGGDAVTDIKASGTLTLDAQKGAGNAADALGALETQVTGLSGETHSGDFQLDNTGALEILTANGFTGVTIDDRPAPVDPGSIISITAASPITVSSAVTNYDGGDIVLKALGAAVTDDMTINADISAQGGNGNITLSAGDAITMGAGVTVSAEGTGSVNLTASGSDITMTGTSVISTEDGDISITAANDFVVGTVNADSNADGIAGDITTASTAGSTTKAIVTTADTFTADVLNMTAGGDIGQAANRIFYTANTIVTAAGGSIYVGPEPTPPAPTPSGTSAETRSEVALAIQVLFNNPNPVFLDQYGKLDGRYAFDMPPAGNVDNFSFVPMIGISTSGIDVMPILGVGIVPLGVPLPPPAVPPVPIPMPSEELPPLVVPLPTLAQPPVYGASGEGLQPIYLSLGRGNNAPALFVPWQPLGSTGSADQGLGTDAGSPPFHVSSLSQMVSMVRDRIRQMQSPIEAGEGLVGGGPGTPPAPMGSETSGT